MADNEDKPIKGILLLFSLVLLIPVCINGWLLQKELIIYYTGGKSIATVDSVYYTKAESDQYSFDYSFTVNHQKFSTPDYYPTSTPEHRKGEKLLVAYDVKDPSESYIVSAKNERSKIISFLFFLIASGVCFYYHRKNKATL